MFTSKKLTYHKFLKTSDYDSYCCEQNMNALDLTSYFMGFPHDRQTIDRLSRPNPFIRSELRSYTVAACVSAMKKYNSLLHFFRFAFRRMKKSVCTDDLSLSPLSVFKKNALYDVFDRGNKYTFRVSDLISLIHSSLTRSHEFICDPVTVKNPYTGQPFPKPVLYRFFVHLNMSQFAVPVLFSLFTSTDFDLRIFLLKYEPILRDIVIKSVVDNMTNVQKSLEIRNMLLHTTIYDDEEEAHIPILNPNRVTPTLMVKLRPLLHHYFIYLYSLNPYYRQASNTIILKTLLSYIKG